jgi:hypothetical protein
MRPGFVAPSAWWIGMIPTSPQEGLQMRVALVGATGLIGQHLVPALTARGDQVVALVRRPTEIAGAATVVWDPAAGPVPRGSFDGSDAVVNLAGAPIGQRWNAQVKKDLATSRVGVTEAVVAAIGTKGPRVLVNGSAVGFYGSRDEPVDETSPAGTGFLPDLCQRWEAAAMAAAADGVRVVLLRTGVVLSTAGGVLPQMLGPAKLGLAGPIAGGKQWFPWVHIDDAVGLILHALDTPEISGPMNLVAPGIVRQADFAKALGRAVNRPAIAPTPAFAIKVILGEGAQVVLEGQNVVSQVAFSTGYRFRFTTPDEALGDTLGDAPED